MLRESERCDIWEWKILSCRPKLCNREESEKLFRRNEKNEMESYPYRLDDEWCNKINWKWAKVHIEVSNLRQFGSRSSTHANCSLCSPQSQDLRVFVAPAFEMSWSSMSMPKKESNRNFASRPVPSCSYGAVKLNPSRLSARLLTNNMRKM